MSDDTDYTGTHRVILPRKFFSRPSVYLGGLIGNTDELRHGYELDGLETPVYVRWLIWLTTAALIWAIPLVCL